MRIFSVALVAVLLSLESAVLERYNVQGTGRISGQGFLRQVGGGVVTCAGSEVFLMPKMRFTDQLIVAVRSGKTVVPIKSIALKYPLALRKTACDAQGNFSFDDLAVGDWFVGTDVTWGVPSRYTVQRQGGGLGTYIKVKAGRETKVLLTDAHRL
jgi:hypothetical protein